MTLTGGKKLVFVMMCLGAIVVISLTAQMAMAKSRYGDLATNLRFLIRSELTSESRVTKNNTTGQQQQRQEEEKGAKNVSQNIIMGEEGSGDLRKAFIKPQAGSMSPTPCGSKPPPNIPTPSRPGTSREALSESNVNATVQEQQRQREVTRPIGVSQNTTVEEESAKYMRKPFIKPQMNSESFPNTPTTNTPGETVSEREADTVSNASEALNGNHQNISVTIPRNLPSKVLDLYKRLVVVTAYSSNHFEEGKGMIASVQKYMPQTQILLYDLGLTAEQRSIATKYCNVKIQTFQWDKYPEHVKNLTTYAWKPLIAREVSQEYDVIMYGDSSVRVISPHIWKALACLLEFPFIDGRPYDMAMISFTDDRTIDYFQFPPSRQHMARWGTLQAGSWLMWANDLMKQKVIEPWVDCALHPECIAPAGTSTENCRMKDLKYKDGRFIGCHRYDQSALNIILAKQFGVQLYHRLGNGKIPNQVWTVERKPAATLHVRICV